MQLKKDSWSKKEYQKYIEYLIEISEPSYKEFHSKLTTTKYEVLGIRVPIIRNIAKEIKKGNYQEFLKFVGNTYYEEVLIEGLIIETLQDFNLIEKFLPKIDNWAICDSLSLKWINKNLDEHFEKILSYLKSNQEYTVRFGLVMLLAHYTKDEYVDRIFKELDKIKLDLYYVNMAMAWLLCECYVKVETKTEKYLLNSKVNNWTFNKAISKIRESYRVSKEKKEYLNTLKRK